MMTPPPPTPAQKTLRRVQTVAYVDGWGVVAVAGLSLLLTLATGQLMGLFVSAFVLLGGVIELRGRRALLRRDPDGVRLLVRAQLIILAVILVYCLRCILSFDTGYLRDQVLPEANQALQAMLGVSLNDLLGESGLTTADLVPLVRQAFMLTYAAVAVTSLLYQGGLALYYRRRADLVREALAAPPPLA